MSTVASYTAGNRDSTARPSSQMTLLWRYRDLLREIVEFAALEKFIHTPIKYYSSWMEARLAFSVAVCAEADVLLLDEVLAVGDGMFRERCLDRLRAFHAGGGR